MHLTQFVIFFLFALLAAYFVFSHGKVKNTPVVADSDKIKILNEHNFDHQIKRGVILVDFWAAWCMPCKMMAPILNALAEEVSGNASVGKLNVDQQQTVSLKYGVKSIPTMLLFKNGQEINRFVGFKSKEFLLQEILKAQ